jgi:hypothetical protein
VAVRADHVAPRDLGGQHRNPDAAVHEFGDVVSLLVDVIELEDDRVGLAAIQASVTRKVVEDEGPCLVDAPSLQVVVAPPVPLRITAVIGLEAGTAPPLTAVGVAIERA